ncbi:MAG: hypothetical protein VKL60_17205 [Sphaerospermopsis sp.]|jgi:hypothetical protein|uniref:Uncharacterized protein n=1 Tax=Sphaerospermopsis aphanizomenoides LEGE 00250 TaxID=2777972 RepID=A0ABR9V7M6_9CYAN|nr:MULTISPECIES: hypothetical protein [Sphaerospermopsis]MBC5793835.1 hypothetical protein [Sphaerospermopsis sp. LEGE 00249]MBE9234502.1 hypothetical protein [Sphaerospermopsis aphanizomenoides LEGE 00250]MEB3150738.1 hypothetical protein [Sphaerospermopsis sp.]
MYGFSITKPLLTPDYFTGFLKLAQSKGGSISLTDAVIELAQPTSEVRSILETICTDGLMEITNDKSTGAIIYKLL